MSTLTISVDTAYFDPSKPEEVQDDIKRTGFNNQREFKSPVTDDELPPHWHSTDIISYVVAGSTYFIDHTGKKHPASAGDRVVIPAGAHHAEGAVASEVRCCVQDTKL